MARCDLCVAQQFPAKRYHTGACEPPLEKNNSGKTRFQSVKSGAREQFLLPLCKAKARTKREPDFFSRTPVSWSVLPAYRRAAGCELCQAGQEQLPGCGHSSGPRDFCWESGFLNGGASCLGTRQGHFEETCRTLSSKSPSDVPYQETPIWDPPHEVPAESQYLGSFYARQRVVSILCLTPVWGFSICSAKQTHVMC